MISSSICLVLVRYICDIIKYIYGKHQVCVWYWSDIFMISSSICLVLVRYICDIIKYIYGKHHVSEWYHQIYSWYESSIFCQSWGGTWVFLFCRMHKILCNSRRFARAALHNTATWIEVHAYATPIGCTGLSTQAARDSASLHNTPCDG